MTGGVTVSEKQKCDLIVGILVAAMLPVEVESELIAYVKARRLEAATIKDFAAGAECMRRMAMKKIMELEEGCLGIQRATFVVSRNAVEHLEIVGIG